MNADLLSSGPTVQPFFQPGPFGPGKLRPQNPLEAQRVGSSIPHVPFIDFEFMLRAQFAKFVLKRSMFVMCRLVVDVFHDFRKVGLAY